jgi:hypothetical protein
MDIHVENHGSLFLLWPQSLAGDCWLREHTAEDAQWCGPGRGGSRGRRSSSSPVAENAEAGGKETDK